MNDEDVFDFGKYKGCRLDRVIEANPSYVVWAHWNVKWFKLTNDQLHRAEENISKKRPTRKWHFWFWDGDDHWDGRDDDWVNWP